MNVREAMDESLRTGTPAAVTDDAGRLRAWIVRPARGLDDADQWERYRLRRTVWGLSR